MEKTTKGNQIPIEPPADIVKELVATLEHFYPIGREMGEHLYGYGSHEEDRLQLFGLREAKELTARWLRSQVEMAERSFADKLGPDLWYK